MTKIQMPLKKYVPQKPQFAPLGNTRVFAQSPSPGPVLVPIATPTPTPSTGGAFSSAFSNAFDN